MYFRSFWKISTHLPKKIFFHFTQKISLSLYSVNHWPPTWESSWEYLVARSEFSAYGSLMAHIIPVFSSADWQLIPSDEKPFLFLYSELLLPFQVSHMFSHKPSARTTYSSMSKYFEFVNAVLAWNSWCLQRNFSPTHFDP